MFLLVPIGFLVVGAIVVMLLLSNNLKRLEGEAAAASRRLDRARAALQRQEAPGPARDEALDEVARAAALYNNAATLYNNAGVAFPANLVARRLGHRPLNTVEVPRGASGAVSSAVAKDMVTEGTRIMNAYMLWTDGMSDYTMEEVAEAEEGAKGAAAR